MLKLRIVTIAILMSLFLSGCDLSETMRSGVTAEDYFRTPSGFEDLTFSMYEPLYTMYGRYHGTITTVLGTDIFEYGSGARPFNNDYTAGLNPTVTSRGWYPLWPNIYRGINATNSVIERVEGVEGISDEQAIRWTAEAKFLRAHYYHILVQVFGPVHLTLEETVGVETEAERAPKEEIWNVIVSDLEYAIENLPTTTSDKGRASGNAARHLLARAHLIQQNWQEAADLAIDVIDSGDYSMVDSFVDLWDPCAIPRGGATEESIFVMTKNQDTRAVSAQQKSRRFASRTRGEAGIIASFTIGQTVSRYRPTEFFVTEVFGNTREHDVNQWNDERWKMFKDVWYYNHEAALPEGIALGDTAIYFTTTPEYQEMSRSEIDQLEEERGYRIFRLEDRTDRLWPSLAYKFRICDPAGAEIPHNGLPTRSQVGAGNPEEWYRTVTIFRLAETYLIAAEALMNLARSNEAADYFNVVRQRAEAPGETIALITPDELDNDAILDERARELAGEYLRWFDLKRMGSEVFLERIRTHNPAAAPNVQEHHMRKPIPQAQIDRTTNDYPQNPGY